MSTEKEINDAIAIVQEAAREGRLEFRSISTSQWLVSTMHQQKYRAKPDPVERWVLIDQDGLIAAIRHKKEEVLEIADGRRIVHLREVE